MLHSREPDDFEWNRMKVVEVEGADLADALHALSHGRPAGIPDFAALPEDVRFVAILRLDFSTKVAFLLRHPTFPVWSPSDPTHKTVFGCQPPEVVLPTRRVEAADAPQVVRTHEPGHRRGILGR